MVECCVPAGQFAAAAARAAAEVVLCGMRAPWPLCCPPVLVRPEASQASNQLILRAWCIAVAAVAAAAAAANALG
jgi:hypothetical protein